MYKAAASRPFKPHDFATDTETLTNPVSSPSTTTPSQSFLRNAASAVAHNHGASAGNAIPLGSENSRGPATPPIYIQGRQHSRNLSNAGLHVHTNLPSSSAVTHSPVNSSPLAGRRSSADIAPAAGSSFQHYSSSPSLMSSYFGIHASRSALDMKDCLSPASVSAMNSPALSAMIDLTPLPSPLYPGESSPRPFSLHHTRGSVDGGMVMRTVSNGSIPSRSNSVNQSPRRKKPYGNLMSAAVEAQAANSFAAMQNGRHGRNRSISEFVPETLHNIRPRMATFGSTALDSSEGSKSQDSQMHREEYLAAQRGLTPGQDPTKTLPSPPPSNKSVTEEEADEEVPGIAEEDGVEYFTIHSGPQKKKRKWRSVRQLGQGTFSKVVLATSQSLPSNMSYETNNLDPHRLVAVKIVEHGPAGGADEERIKHSLDREIEILKHVSHPSIVHLKAMEELSTKSLLVLTYCPGGDLFEFASEKRELLTANLVQRMFAELVGAVRYLHKNWIVHRDIKLENVLVNIPASELTPDSLPSPQTSPIPLVTLTDLGLSRRISPAPASPLLTTRCGSEDYAAPEILLGQPYDGRATDAWALGVLLYALIEGRLPFDAPPGKPDRSRNTHRIARCDWIWCKYGDEDGEWDDGRPGAAAWRGARECVDGLLKKVRMGRKPLEEIESREWVREGVRREGGVDTLKRRGSEYAVSGAIEA